MKIITADVLVIGGGAAGLAGALELALSGKSVALIEAKPYTGGRIKTVNAHPYPIELGAEFVHGNLPLTKSLLQEAGIRFYPTEGNVWQFRNGELRQQDEFIEDFDTLQKKFSELKEDKPVRQFLEEELAGEAYQPLRFTVENYVKGYYAADPRTASTAALSEDLTTGDEEQYRTETGYGALVTHLEKKCRSAGVQFFLSQTVHTLAWEKGRVSAIADAITVTGKCVLVTVSVGVLKSGSLKFSPSIPHIREAVQRLGFGQVLKVVIQFKTAFWKKDRKGDQNLADLGFLFSTEEIPTWWTHFPKDEPLLTGWLGGPGASAMLQLPENVIREKAVSSLSRSLGVPVGLLEKELKALWYYNWSADPHFCGAYSYEVVGGTQHIEKLLQPIDDTVYFAGEGLHHGKEIGTVESALQSGKSAAAKILETLSA